MGKAVTNLESFIGKKFNDNEVIKLEKLIIKIKASELIPKGTLVIMASGDSQLFRGLIKQ